MRIIHNTSFIIAESLEQEWIDFIREHYIAYLREKEIVADIIFTKVSIDQPEGKTYSLQLVFHSEGGLDDFQENHLPLIEEKLINKYKNRYLCFSSLLYEL